MADWKDAFMDRVEQGSQVTENQEEQLQPTPWFEMLVDALDERTSANLNSSIENLMLPALGRLVENQNQTALETGQGFNAIAEAIGRLERRIAQVENMIADPSPAMTNLAYDAPKVFEEITTSQAQGVEADVQQEESKNEEGSTSSEEIDKFPIEMVDGYHAWKAKEISWADFVKMCGGVSKAAEIKNWIEGSPP
tara:strand:- start:10 stop:594 length:585 start_codon:yes stop_codon:yes gene_type:complete